MKEELESTSRKIDKDHLKATWESSRIVSHGVRTQTR